MPEPLLRITGLVSPFGGPYDLDLQAGECVSVMGASGSGKSVLLRLVADLDPGAGSVRLAGRERHDVAAPDWRRQVMYQAAEAAWWAPTMREHLPAAALPEAETSMAALGLPVTALDADIARLSTGERQRLALVRSLACAPRVLLLDEPSASLDPASTAAMEMLLHARLRAGLGVILVTHSAEQAARLAHRRFTLAQHRLTPA